MTAGRTTIEGVASFDRSKLDLLPAKNGQGHHAGGPQHRHGHLWEGAEPAPPDVLVVGLDVVDVHAQPAQGVVVHDQHTAGPGALELGLHAVACAVRSTDLERVGSGNSM